MSDWHWAEQTEGVGGNWSKELILSPEYLATNPDWQAGLGAWLLYMPRAWRGPSDMWTHYYLGAVHLRDIEGQTKPAYKQFPSATHEVMCYALDPDRGLEPGKWSFLSPANFVAQVTCSSDAIIREVVELGVDRVINELMPIEDGGEQMSKIWRKTLDKTIEHTMTGGHYGA